ncbi:MAG: hypothetical protein AAF578_00375 [Pseudomonadota bacterium]
MALRYDTQALSSGLLYDTQDAFEGGGTGVILSGFAYTLGQGTFSGQIASATTPDGIAYTLEQGTLTTAAPDANVLIDGIELTHELGLLSVTGDGAAQADLTGIEYNLVQGDFVDRSSQITLDSIAYTYGQGSLTVSPSDGSGTNIVQPLTNLGPMVMFIGQLTAGTERDANPAITGIEYGLTQGALSATGEGATLLDRVTIKGKSLSIVITERR